MSRPHRLAPITPVSVIGPEGPQGDRGVEGPGVPAGGTENQVLIKTSALDFSAHWGDGPPAVVDFASTAEAIAGVSDVKSISAARLYETLPHFNVRSKGAVGDDATNDTTAVVDTVNAAISAGGGNILLEHGHTFVTDRLLLTSTAVPLRFYGGGVIKLRTASTAVVQVASPTAPVMFEGLKFDGNGLTLTNVTCGLLRATGAGLMVLARGCEFTNSPQSGPTSISGGRLQVEGGSAHDLGMYGTLVQGSGAASVRGLDVYDCGNGGIKVTNTSVVSSEGVAIVGNTIRDIRADLGGTGEYGNGISVFQVDNVAVAANAISNTAFSFIRTNKGDNTTITGNTGYVAGEVGIFVEIGAQFVSVTGNVLDKCNSHGISVSNASNGTQAVSVVGNIIREFSVNPPSYALDSWGIGVTYGSASGNIIDGKGNTGATWGLILGPAQGAASSDFKSLVIGNQIAGVKYAMGHAGSHTSGTPEAMVVSNQVTRQDANWNSPIGRVGTGVTDGGTGATITTHAAFLWYDGNNFDFVAGTEPPATKVGSTLKIGGVWYRSTGTVWTPLYPDGTWNSAPLRLGANYLWVDATGDLRIKSSAPASDTDGTVVGTQT